MSKLTSDQTKIFNLPNTRRSRHAAMHRETGRAEQRNLFLQRFLATILVFWGVVQATMTRADEFTQTEQDQRLSKLLNEKRSHWRDLNVPFQDGVFLRNFILERNVRSVVEIGTSTGHSGLWIAWGLTKTDGRLVTFEIDEQRYRTAQKNFTEARLADHIDSRLESARTGILAVKVPVDMVFLDGDRSHYRHYFETLSPMLSDGGCFVTHNIGSSFWDAEGYLTMVRGTSGFETEIVQPSNEAIAITCKIGSS